MKLQSKKSWRALASAGLAGGLLVACGGGTQVESFRPERIVSFGDESSFFNNDGTKYTVNGVVFDTAVTPNVPKTPIEIACETNLLWNQQVAYNFGLGFENRCVVATRTNNGKLLATVNGKVADVSAQVTSFLAGDAFSGKDLVTLMVGVNDIKDAIENAANPAAAVEAAGNAAGVEVVRITDRGAKVLVSTVPDVGLTPWAVAREATNPGTIALATDLTHRFNTRLRLKLQDVRDGGHAVGLVLGDELVLAMTRFPANYGIVSTTLKYCGVALPACNQTTPDIPAGVASASYGNEYLWADSYRMGANAQSRLGSIAVNRARTNPF